MTEHDDKPVLLDPGVDTTGEVIDHPLEVTPEEAVQGRALWEAVDDLDDDDNGIDPPGLRTASPGRAEALRRAKIVRACLLDAGVPQVAFQLMEGRPGPADPWNGCKPVQATSHHIVSRPIPADPTPGLRLVIVGRSDLPGPLANGTAGVDLVYRILTCGWANHPGFGGPMTVRGPMGTYTIPKDIGRPYMWGTEYEGGIEESDWDKTYTNKRTGMSMTFREFMGRCNAGLVRAVWLINGTGRSPGEAGELDLSMYHGEHKTWAPGRKPDRLNYTTGSGRAEIRKYNDGGDDVSAKDVWEFAIKPRIEGATAIPARLMLAQTHHKAEDARKNAVAAAKNSEAALRQARANRAAIKAVADTLDGDASTKVTAALGPDLDDPVVRAEDVPEDPKDDETE